MAYGTHAEARERGRHRPGCEPGGAHDEAGRDRRPECERGDRQRPRAHAHCPLTRFTVRGVQAAGGVSVRTSPGEPRGRRDQAVRRRRRRHQRGVAAQDRAGLLPRGLPPAAGRPARRARVPAPSPRAVLERSAPGGRRRPRSGRARRRSSSTTRSGRPRSSVRRSWAGSAATPWPSTRSPTSTGRVLLREDIERLLGALVGSCAELGLGPRGPARAERGDRPHRRRRGPASGATQEALFAFLSHETAQGVTDVALPGLVLRPVRRGRRGDGERRSTGRRRPSRTDGARRALRHRLRRRCRTAPCVRRLHAGPGRADDVLQDARAARRRGTTAERGRWPTSRRRTWRSRDVQTPWDLKGAVMRHVASSAEPGAT